MNPRETNASFSVETPPLRFPSKIQYVIYLERNTHTCRYELTQSKVFFMLDRGCTSSPKLYQYVNCVRANKSTQEIVSHTVMYAFFWPCALSV